MTTITVYFPTAEEDDLIRRFTVNKNYLQAIALFLARTYGRGLPMYSGLQASVTTRPQHRRIQRVAMPLDDVRRYLTRGWVSEIQLGLPAEMGNEAVVAYSNAWAPVHAYYAVFGLLQAWFAANGLGGTADDHTAALRTIAKMIEQRDLFPEPWNLLAVGCPMRDERMYLNEPAGANCAGHVEVLSIPTPFGNDSTFWQRYGTWLRSTREARLKAREEKVKKANCWGRISPKARTQIAASVAPTSLFDCFWRLRIKSNYGDIDPYLVAHIDAGEHLVFNRALRITTAATLGLLELYVMQRIGRPDFQALAREFVVNDGAGMTAATLEPRLAQFGL